MQNGDNPLQLWFSNDLCAIASCLPKDFGGTIGFPLLSSWTSFNKNVADVTTFRSSIQTHANLPCLIVGGYMGSGGFPFEFLKMGSQNKMTLWTFGNLALQLEEGLLIKFGSEWGKSKKFGPTSFYQQQNSITYKYGRIYAFV